MSFDLRAILFDMDGVLYDSMPAHQQSWQETFDELGFKSITPNEFYLHEGRTGKSTINLLFERELGRKASSEEIKRIYERKTELFHQFNSGNIIPEALNVLLQVQHAGYGVVLVTGSGQPALLNRLDSNFPGFFSPPNMVTGHDVKHGKPHPEPFLMGLQKGGNLQPNQAIVIENAPLGVEAAVKAGIFTIAVNTGPLSDTVLKDAGANIVFASMHELHEKLPSIFDIARTCYS